jgi:tetratricopeptide (TPR) repeat protein
MVHKRVVDAIETADPKFKHWKTRIKTAAGAFEQGELTETRALMFRALAEAEGLQDKAFAVPACNLGIAVVSLQQGNLKESKEYFDKGLSAVRTQPDPASVELYAAGLRFRAMLHEREGDLAEAENCLRESVSILQKLNAESAIQLAYSLSDLSYILVRTEQIEEAALLIRSAMEILIATVGSEDPTFDWAKIIYQICHFSRDEESLMETFEMSAIKWQYKVGAKHPNLIRALSVYAAALKKHGHTERLKELIDNFSGLLDF